MIAVLAVTLAAAIARAARDSDEPPPAFKASTLLTPALLQGPHHRVAEDVRTEGYFHEFTISSAFGSFPAVGRSQVTVRVAEINALAALHEVSKTEVFLGAAGRSVVNVGKGAGAVVTDPVGTAKGLGAGVKRLGINLGRRTQRAVDSAGDPGTAGDEDKKNQDSAAESAAKSLLGVNAAMRRWAQKVGVDPYTTNAALRSALEDIAKVDAAGSIATNVVVPIPAVVSMASNVGNLVWAKDPEEVRKINEQRLRDLGVADEVAKALFRNGSFTLTSQTRLTAALHAVNASGCADYIRTATEAQGEREALFFVESAEMLQEWHARQRVTALLPDSRALVGTAGTGRAVVLLPLDWVGWSAASDTALREIGARAKQELGATRLELVLTGRASTRMMREVAALGWTIVASPPSTPAHP